MVRIELVAHKTCPAKHSHADQRLCQNSEKNVPDKMSEREPWDQIEDLDADGHKKGRDGQHRLLNADYL